MVDWITYRNGHLNGDGVDFADIVTRFGSPTYVYSRRAIEAAYQEFAQAAIGQRALICYALKANSNLAIIDILARSGAGFDIVSGGELQRVIAAGGDPRKIVFSGVGKRCDEITQALAAQVRCFNVESPAELHRLSQLASAAGIKAPVSLRVNPDVNPGTHPYISTGLKHSKFGIAHHQALAVYAEAAELPGIEIHGIDCHIGSQIVEIAPFLAALDKVIELIEALAQRGIHLRHLDLGGGLGIRYDNETPPARQALLACIFERLAAHPIGSQMEVIFEFGRSLVGNAGVLLTRVEHLKRNGEHNFAIIDAAMNDLMRPALYDAYHQVLPAHQQPTVGAETGLWDLVGPVCESGDWLARQRHMTLAAGDTLAILSAGAYGMAMSSNYNTRPRAAEVLIDAGQAYLIRERESVDALFALERRLAEQPAGGL